MLKKHKKGIDTSNLKKDARGRNDWNGSIGANIPFNYFGKEGFLNLVKCDGRNAHVECKRSIIAWILKFTLT